MKKLLVVLFELKWYSLNTQDFNDFEEILVLNNKNILITFQASDLIRDFKSQEILQLPPIINLESFDMQMSQEGKNLRKFTRWNETEFLKRHNMLPSEFKLSKNNIKHFLEKIALLYNSFFVKDEHETEIKRFSDLEVNVNKMIHDRQIKGVYINQVNAIQNCKFLEKYIYNIKNDLQLNYNIFTPEDKLTQIDFLKKNNLSQIESLRYSFKMHSYDNDICKLFYELLRSQQDFDSLVYTLSQWGGNERTYPTYVGFGTITSRIILRQPSLQTLRKSNRNIIIPDQGKKLLYIDYSQFEAGILADLSKDHKMIKLYNSDIYLDLAEKVIGNKEERKQAKIIFYRYIYGDDSLNKKATNYFQQFVKLNEFKNEIEEDILQNKKLGSPLGNFRSSLNGDHKWALSHVVQSTAAYIYKMALVRVYKEIDKADFLIPMHDGTVYQICEEEYDVVKENIEKIYREEFKKVCPQISPKLNFNEKFE